MDGTAKAYMVITKGLFKTHAEMQNNVGLAKAEICSISMVVYVSVRTNSRHTGCLQGSWAIAETPLSWP